MNTRDKAIQLFIRRARRQLQKHYPNHLSLVDVYLGGPTESINDQGFYYFKKVSAELVAMAARTNYRWDGTRTLSCEDRPGDCWGRALTQEVY